MGLACRERRAAAVADGQLVEGYAVGGRHSADLGGAQAGNDQGAVGTELDGGAPQGQGVGQFSRL